MTTESDPHGEPFPGRPCELCTGYSAVRKPGGELMTSEELCRDLNVCTSTVDWEVVFNGDHT